MIVTIHTPATPAEKRAKAKARSQLLSQYSECRKYMKAGKTHQAEEYAKFRGFTVQQAMAIQPKTPIAKRRAPAPAPLPVEPPPEILVTAEEPPTVLVAPENATEFVNGWPVECEAEIWRSCRNRRLVIIQLPDGREAAMWRGPIQNWRPGAKVRVRLDDATADPYYFHVRQVD